MPCWVSLVLRETQNKCLAPARTPVNRSIFRSYSGPCGPSGRPRGTPVPSAAAGRPRATPPGTPPASRPWRTWAGWRWRPAFAPPRGRRPGRPSPGPARAAPRPARGRPDIRAGTNPARPPSHARAYRRGSRVAADPKACAMDGHGDPPVGRGASTPPCRDGTIPAHGRSPWDPDPETSSTPSVRVISSRIDGADDYSNPILESRSKNPLASQWREPSCQRRRLSERSCWVSWP